VANGPGSFTGIRIGVSAAKGLAFASDKPVVGVSTLEAMARNVSFADGLVICAMDARRQQVYNALFQAESGRLRRLTPDRPIALADLAEELRGNCGRKTVVGDGGALCRQFLVEAGIPCELAPPHLLQQNAVSVALAAEELFDRAVSAQELLPVYLRPPQAERLRDRQAKTSEPC
jgi:tRNA threonylcarbamoyladenosine biosynthesis protein TsaB